MYVGHICCLQGRVYMFDGQPGRGNTDIRAGNSRIALFRKMNKMETVLLKATDERQNEHHEEQMLPSASGGEKNIN